MGNKGVMRTVHTNANDTKASNKRLATYHAKVFLLISAVACTLIVAIGFIAITITADSLEKSMFEKTEMHVQTYTESINAHLSLAVENLLTYVEIVKKRFDFSDMESGQEVFIRKIEEAIPDILETAIVRRPYKRALYVYLNPDYYHFHYNVSYELLPSGETIRLRVLPTEGYMLQNPDIRWLYDTLAAKQPLWTSNFYWDLFRDDFVSFNVPIMVGEQVAAVMGFFLDYSQLGEIIEHFSLQDMGDAFLLDENFKVIFHPLFGSKIPFTELDPVSNKLLDSVSNSNNMAVFSEFQPDNEEWLFLAKLDSNWIAGFSVPERAMKQESSETITRMNYLFLLAIIVAVVFLYFIAKISTKPVETLVKVIGSYYKGDFTVRFSLKGKSEISILGNAFNELADQLENRIGTINQQNDDISSINEQLEAVNQQLQESYNRAEELAAGLHKTILLASKTSLKTFESQYSFLKESLDTVLSLIPNADFGTVFSFSNDEYAIVSFTGHRYTRYYQVPKEKLVLSDEPFLIANDYGLPVSDTESNTFMPESYSLERKPVYKTLGVYLKVGEEVFGLVTLDIAKGRDFDFTEQETAILNSFANIASSFLAIRTFLQKSENFQKEIILSIIKILELYDPYTQGHSENVALLSSVIAEELKLKSEDTKQIYWAGLVHDIGKILVPSEILKKKGKLTDEEYMIIQKHPQWGAEVLHSSGKLRSISDYVLFHHERWDGKGYPVGLKGEEIPVIARIITIADSLEAMTADRPYRKGMEADIAFKELLKCAGTQFDPELINRIFSRATCMEKLRAIIRKKEV
jgi:putative nucleotidyltransferase with HDIG domain